MPKIRLNQLPDGFEIKNGKVIKKMKSGGAMTGDQKGYGLVTDPYNYMGDQFNNNKDNDIRFSLSSVPREMANIEAEGGETVLTDLNDDGQFGLYNITGPRHSSGGVPMFLPEQSFIYSDTAKMKMNKRELAEFGIESKKKMTPAKVSKKFQLNEYVGALKDRDADFISINSAEQMIEKNSRSLSKLAFGQEAKKNFAEGVPLAAFPYLMEQGIDPIEFQQKVANISREQAMQQLLTPEQAQQMMALQQMVQQSNQMPAAQIGRELPQAQMFNSELRDFNKPRDFNKELSKLRDFGFRIRPMDESSELPDDKTGRTDNPFGKLNFELGQLSTTEKTATNPATGEGSTSSAKYGPNPEWDIDGDGIPNYIDPDMPAYNPTAKTSGTTDNKNITSFTQPERGLYRQDLMKMGALARRDREYMPAFQPAVQTPSTGYVIGDDTAFIGGINAQLNTLGQALGATSGPQTTSARLSRAQGQAFKQVADAQSQVAKQNLGIVNAGMMADTQLRAQADQESRIRKTKEYDDTTLARQRYIDEKNLDREQMADLYADAITNAVNRENLSSMFPQFDIDRSGRVVYNKNAKQMSADPNAAGSQFQQQMNYIKALQDSGLTLGNDDIVDIIKAMPFPSNTNTTSGLSTDDMLRILLRNTTTETQEGKNGGQILPFYTGSVGI